MTHRRTPTLRATAALLLCSLTPFTLGAQSPPLNRNVVVLDPAHGGDDTGARIADNLEEKDVTLAFAARLRPMLAAAGFTVAATRDSDPAAGNSLDPDQRAGIANHPHAIACLLIHATPSGSGVHLFNSSLPPADTDPTQPTPWDAAQGPYISLSLRLANQLGLSLLHASIPPLLGHASIRPLDNLTCPAVAIELAPLLNPNADPTLISDAAYQQHIAQAIVAALVAWRNQVAPTPTSTTPAPTKTNPTTAPTTMPKAAPTAAPATPKPVPAAAPTAAPKAATTPTPAPPPAAPRPPAHGALQ